jgi:hypothetical protein
MAAAFALAAIPARRRLAVIGTPIGYAEGRPADVVAQVTAEALGVASEAWLYKISARNAAPVTLADARVRGYETIRALADDLWALEAGELALVKGARVADHLGRVGLRATHDVQCWVDDCTKRLSCSRCPLLGPALQ